MPRTDTYRLALSLAAALRLVLFSFTSLPGILERRPELASPLTSFRSLREGVFLWTRGVNPYEGGVFYHSPLHLVAVSESYALTIVSWTLIDVLAATSLVRISRSRQTSRDGLVAALFLFNPYTLLSCLARSTVTLDNAMILFAIASAAHGDALLFGTALALATHTSLYPILLLPASILLVGKRRAQLVSLLTFSTVLALVALANTYQFGRTWMDHSWGTILSVSNLTPNVGMWWYFFTEMFDHFRAFFLGVFQLHHTIYVVPICLRLSYDPLFAILITLGVIVTWKSYPTLGDMAVWAGLLGCFSDVITSEKSRGKADPDLRHPLFTLTVHLYTAVLLPLLHSLWLLSGTGNANFFYAASMVYGLNASLAVVDVLSAGLKANIRRRIKMEWKDDYEIVQLTSAT